MSFYRISHALLFISIVSMLLGPVSEAKARAGLTNQIGLKNTATLQNKGLSGLKDLNTQSLLTQSSTKKSASKQVSIQKSDEELLSKLSQDIYWKLKDWQDSKSNTLLAQDEKQELSNWISQLDSLQIKVNKNMNKLTQWIKDKKLPAIIMQRQQDAISTINTEIEGLKQQLSQLNQASSLSSSKQQLKGSFDFFKGKQLKRKHQVFDGLSSVALTPDRVPVATKTADFNKYNFTSKTNNPQNTAAFNDPAYLGTSDEVVINQYIQDKATELENDPVKIYHWVRNNIEWLPSYGAIQASDITLGSGRGNAFDQASLLIAMLRAANVPARYAYGTIEVDIDKFTNWVGLTNPEAALTFVQYGAIPVAPIIEGGVIKKVQMEHIWVEAAIDFNPSRGAKNITPDSWVSLDASFKQYEVLTGLDPIAISGVDMNQVAQDFIASGVIDGTAGRIQGLDTTIINNAQENIKNSVINHIQNNTNLEITGDVVGGRRNIVKQYPTLPASLKNKVLLNAGSFAEMLEEMRPKYRIAFEKDILGNIINPLELNFATLNNHKLTLSFKPATIQDQLAFNALIPNNPSSINDLPSSIPAHLIRVIPQLSLDDIVLKQGNSMNFGYDLSIFFEVQITNAGIMKNQYKIPAGSYVNLMFNPGSISKKVIDDLHINLNNTKLQIESGSLNISREQFMGDLFFMSSLVYNVENSFFSKIIANSLNAGFNLSPIFGTAGIEPNVTYLFGLPINIKKGALAMNLYTSRQIVAENSSKNLLLNQLIGVVNSYLEHSIYEQQYRKGDTTKEGISTMKLLSKALTSNQSIFILSSANIESLDSDINLNPETEQEINQAVQSGYIVIAHENIIDINGWSGGGYIIANPYTGDASYRITGGRNGGEMDDPTNGFMSFMSNISDSHDMSIFFLFIDIGLIVFGAGKMAELSFHVISIFTLMATIIDGCDGEGQLVVFYAFIILTSIFSFMVVFVGATVGLFPPASIAAGRLVGFIMGIMLSALLDSLVNYMGNHCDELLPE